LERSDNPGVLRFEIIFNPEESVGKIKNRRKQGYQNHSTLPENALERKYGPKFFGDHSLRYFSDRL